jgi:hypothetical protein
VPRSTAAAGTSAASRTVSTVGDRVVVDGTDRLKDGAQVRVTGGRPEKAAGSGGEARLSSMACIDRVTGSGSAADGGAGARPRDVDATGWWSTGPTG